MIFLVFIPIIYILSVICCLLMAACLDAGRFKRFGEYQRNHASDVMSDFALVPVLNLVFFLFVVIHISVSPIAYHARRWCDSFKDWAEEKMKK